MMSRTESKFKRLLSWLSVAAIAVSCLALPIPFSETQAETTYPFMDTSLSFEERAADIVSRLTLEEKASQIGNNNPAISRLGIAKYDYWKEGLHGIANLDEGQNATSFPYSLAMAATWDTELMEEVGTAISDEARGYNNQGLRGLSYWSPTINLARDPRWGRNHESYGEDVYLTSALGTGFVDGYMGNNDENNGGYLKVIATLKHYAANNSEYNRDWGSSDMDEEYLREYYTRTFKNIIRNTDIRQVMSCYNRVNGVPASASTLLLDTLLRKTFGFNGYVVSDCGAIKDMFSDHKWIPDGSDHVVTQEEATMYGLTAGCDMDCGSVYPQNAVSAVRSGLLSEDVIDRALLRIFTQRMATGEFDPAEMVPYRSEEYSYANQVESEKHVQLAEDASDEAIVLLKNEAANGSDTPILPLDAASSEKVVVVGELASQNLLGGYSGVPSKDNISTPLQGIEKILGHSVTYINGSGVTSDKYICNSRNLKLTKEDGSELVLDPSMALGFSDCRTENNNANVGYIHANSYYYFPQVDITNTTAVAIETSGGGDTLQGTVEIHMDSPDGMLLAKIKTEQTGSWGNYQYFTNQDPVTLGGYETKDLYVVFTPSVEVSKEVNFTDAQKADIQSADVVIACIGSNGGDSTEGHDRSTIAMPRNQDILVKALAQLNPRTVVYIQSVGVLEIGAFKEDVPAILWTCFNGQAQGNAMARVLFGEHNPSAKLPFTWYADNSQLPTIDDYNLYDESYTNGGWTYQYFDGDIDYPFGYGLSYSTFEYSNLRLSGQSFTPNDTLTATVDVKNTSDVDGREVVQLYVSTPKADGKERPFKELKAFDKVTIKAGETVTVPLTLDISDCYYWDEDAQKNVYDNGTYTVFVGPSSEKIDNMSDQFTVTGAYNPTLAVVTAKADKVVLNAARPDKVLTTELTAAMSDDSFYDLTNDQATVTYESNRPEVAVVDQNGVVTPVGEGQATITVSVTIDGVTKTDSFAVAVINQLNIDSILLDGEKMDTFDPNTTDYYYPVAGNTAPVVSVPAMGDQLKVDITQAAAIPGTATVKVTLGDQSVTYTINFRPQSDQYVAATFSGANGRYTASKGTLSVNWVTVDGGQPVDLMEHRLNDLYLTFTLTLQNGQNGLSDSEAFKGGYIRLRSSDTSGNENNRGWGVSALNLHSGINYIRIPLSQISNTAQTGTIDWTKIDRFRMYIDSTNSHEGPFTMIVQDVMIVDTRYNGTRQHLQTLVEATVNEEDYTPASYAAYNEVKMAAQNLLNNQGASVQLGDVDNDGKISANDALQVLQAATQKITLTENETIRADVDGVAGISANDALQVLQAATQKITLPIIGDGATDDQIRQAIADMMEAKEQLERKVDKTSLREAIEKTVDESLYTEDSVARYKAVLAAAQIVLDNENATQDEVDTALRSLNTARANLKKPNTEPVLATFGDFNREYTAAAGNWLYGSTLYADWHKADQGIVNLDGDRTGLYLIMTMSFTAPDGTDLSKCWASTTIKLRSVDTPEENNYGWKLTPSSEEVIEAATAGVFKIAIPLTKEKDNATGNMDWSQVEKVITTTEINGVGDYRVLAGRNDLTMSLSDTQIVDSAFFDLAAWKAS